MSLQLLLLVCVLLPVVEPACAPLEEGKPTTLTCNVNTAGCPSNIPVLRWRTLGSNPAVVISCYSDGCGGQFTPQYVSATISTTSSTLTINKVSRTDPFNMETGWECYPCVGREPVTACDKLEIYALPTNPMCQVTENPISGDTQSVTFACTYDFGSVYPRAKCSFYKMKDVDEPAEISKVPATSFSAISSNPTYYSSECAVTLTVQELGEGTHKFQGKIYPDVTGGEDMVDWIKPDRTITFILALQTEKDENTEKSGRSDVVNVIAINIAVFTAVIVAMSVVLTSMRYRKLKKTLKATSLYLTPFDTPDIVNNVAVLEALRPGQYEDVDSVGDTTNLTPNTAGIAPESSQDRDIIRRSPAPHASMVSASEGPEINHYETIPKTVTPPSGPYNSTSPQDVEPPAIYNRAIHETPSTTNVTSAGTYSNIPGQTRNL